MMNYYKILRDGKTCNDGNADYHLPENGKPGDWMPKIKGDLIPCENGYHLCRPQDLIHWLDKDIYEAEYRGDIVEDNDKVVVRQVRLVRKVDKWNNKTARLFAVWCAREALKLVDNPDERSVAAVDIAEKFANGEATEDELAAARDAARDAAWAAAWDAARAAQMQKLLEMIGE